MKNLVSCAPPVELMTPNQTVTLPSSFSSNEPSDNLSRGRSADDDDDDDDDDGARVTSFEEEYA